MKRNPRARLTEALTVRLSPEERKYIREKAQAYRSDGEFMREVLQWYEKTQGNGKTV